MSQNSVSISEFPPLGNSLVKHQGPSCWTSTKTKVIIEKNAEKPPTISEKKVKERTYFEKYLDELIFKEFEEREEKRREMERVAGDRDYYAYKDEIFNALWCGTQEERKYARRRSQLYDVWTGHGYVDEDGRVRINRESYYK